MADLDYFKKVNDTHGFNTGDDVLVEVSRVLRGCLRNEDICSRWGGEEFLVLLPETQLDGALAVANKIRESVAMTEFKVNRPGIHLTISLGVCEYKPEQNIFEAISRADQALFQAKRGGRNRAMVAA
jgi:diguanylate cyclase (GGDEF)-like protein